MNIDYERLESLVTSQIDDDMIKKYKLDIETACHNAVVEDGEIIVTIPGHAWFSYDELSYTPISGGGGG